MNTRHVQSLVLLELRRVGPTVLRVQAAALVLAALFVILGRDPAENVLAVLIGTPLGVTLLGPMTIVRDKMEHTMEFLCSLPASASELAVARFAAGALAILPGVALAGIGLAVLGLPAPLELLEGGLLLPMVIGYWLMLSVASWVIAAGFASFEFARLLRWPLALAAFAFIVLPRLIGAALPADPAAWFRYAVVQPWAPAAAALLVLGTLSVAAAVAFMVTRRAFANYRPDFQQPM